MKRCKILSLLFLLLACSLFVGCGKSAYLYYEDAEESANNGDYRTAIEKYEKAVDEFPKNIALRKNLASLYFQTEDYESCISELKKILELDPLNAQIVDELRYAKIKSAQDFEGDYKIDLAITVYEELLKNDPENPVFLQKLADMSRRLGNETERIAYLEKISDVGVQSNFRTPTDKAVHFTLALSQLVAISMKKHDYQKAIELLKKLIEAEPDNIRQCYTLVSLYQKTEQYDRAIDQLWKIEHSLPESQQAEVLEELRNGYLSQAAAFEKKNELEQAIKAYEKALELEPNDNELHHKLGNLYYQTGQIAFAKKHFQESSDLYGINNVAYLHYMHPPEDRSQKIEIPNVETLREFKKFLRECAKEYNVNLSLIVALIKTESNFKPRAISRTKNVGLMQLGVATAKDLGLRVDGEVDERYEPVKNIRGGVKYFRMMLDRFDNVATEALAAYNAGPGSVRSGRIPNYNETRGHIAKVTHQTERYEKYPQEFEIDLNILARNSLECQGKRTEIAVDRYITEAIGLFEKVKTNPVALFNLALLYDEIGQSSQASELYRQLLVKFRIWRYAPKRRAPKETKTSVTEHKLSSTARLNLAYNEFADREYEDAYSLLENHVPSVGEVAEMDDPQYRYQMGLSLTALGKFDQAVKYLAQEEGLTPQQRVSVYNTFGYIYLKSDKLSDARDSFEKALRMEPEDFSASQGIALVELIEDALTADKQSLQAGIIYNAD